MLAQQHGGARALAAVCSCYFVGFLGMNFLPMWLGVLVSKLSSSGAAAGWAGSTELAAMAVGSILTSTRVARINRRRAANLAVAVVVAFNAIGIMTNDLGILTALRIPVGLAEGVLLALAAAGVAATNKPERTMSLVLIVLNVSMALLFLLAPVLINTWGSAGLLALMAVLAAVAAPTIRWFPQRAEKSESRETSANPMPRNANVIISLLCVVLLLIGHGMVFAYVERIGSATSLSLGSIGEVLSASMIIDCLAPTLVIAIGLRWGRVLPVCVGLSTLLVATLAVTQSATPSLFVLGVWLQLFSYTFIMPFFAGILAALDDEGRVVAAMSAAMIVGFMLAPAVGGMLVTDSGSFKTMGWVSGSLYLCIIVALLTLQKWQGRAPTRGLVS
ncbi:MAG: MFS transporter [Dehalococcoidia bacterium]